MRRLARYSSALAVLLFSVVAMGQAKSGGMGSLGGNSVPLSTVTAAGDLIQGSGNGAVTNLPAGSTGQVLTVISPGVIGYSSSLAAGHVSLQSSYPGVPDNGNANLSGSMHLGGSLNVDGSANFSGHAGALQHTTAYSVLGDRYLGLNLENVTQAYPLHSLGQVGHQAIADPAAPIATPVGNKGNTITSAGYGSLTFAASGTTITRTTGSWISDGYVVGSAAVVTGSASNNTTYTISAVTATVLTVSPAPVNETTTAATVAGQFGTKTCTYYVVQHDPYGGVTNVSAAGTTSQCNTTQSASNYNNVSIAWSDGATTADVLSVDTAHLLGTLTKPANSIQDTGQATSAYTAPTYNTTADVYQWGRFYSEASGSAPIMFGWDTVNNPNASSSVHVYSFKLHGTEKFWIDGNGEGWLTSNFHLTGSVVATGAGLKVPVVAGSGTAQQLIQAATYTLVAGALAPTFGTAFSAAPHCTCTDQTAANAVKCVGTATALTIAGTGTDVIDTICVGNQ